MHFEVPKAKTFKEFGAEYLMIVISILTALGLEHGAQSLHHHHLAQQAALSMDVELRGNIDDVKQVIAFNQARVAKLNSAAEELLANIRSGGTDAEIITRFTRQNTSFDLSMQVPSFRRNAWEVAVANQSVTWMEAEELHRYSDAYSAMRDVQSIATVGATTFLDTSGLKDIGSDISTGSANPRQLYRSLNRMISTYQVLGASFDRLQTQLLQAGSARKEH